MQKTIDELKAFNKKIDDMLDNLGSDDFNDGIPFHLEYNGISAELLFCPESVDCIQTMLNDLIDIFSSDYL